MKTKTNKGTDGQAVKGAKRWSIQQKLVQVLNLRRAGKNLIPVYINLAQEKALVLYSRAAIMRPTLTAQLDLAKLCHKKYLASL